MACPQGWGNVRQVGFVKISVIIPVYDAEPYVPEAVRSALAQPETAEVILVEDGSTDASLAQCQTLVKTDPRVRLLQHPDGKNLGVSASRNLGIVNAGGDYIAFLDADDFYLPYRFAAAKDVFRHDESAEGVYEAIGTHFESQAAERVWNEMKGPLLTTIRAGISPERLFEEQSPIGSAGHCSLDGLTVRSKVFRKTGLFDTELAMGEDTAFFIKLASCARLLPGRLEQPVAMRRVHGNNTLTRSRSTNERWQHRQAVWHTVYRWLRNHGCAHSMRNRIISKMLWECQSMVSPDLRQFQCLLVTCWRYLQILRREPSFIAERAFTVGAVRHLRNCLTGQRC